MIHWISECECGLLEAGHLTCNRDIWSGKVNVISGLKGSLT